MTEEGGKSQTRVHETRLGDSRASTMRRSSLAYSSDGMERLGSVVVENCNILRKLFHTAVLLSTSKMEDFGDLNHFFVLRLKNPRVERRGTLLCCEMWRCTYRRSGIGSYRSKRRLPVLFERLHPRYHQPFIIMSQAVLHWKRVGTFLAR